MLFFFFKLLTYIVKGVIVCAMSTKRPLKFEFESQWLLPPLSEIQRVLREKKVRQDLQKLERKLAFRKVLTIIIWILIGATAMMFAWVWYCDQILNQ